MSSLVPCTLLAGCGGDDEPASADGGSGGNQDGGSDASLADAQDDETGSLDGPLAEADGSSGNCAHIALSGIPTPEVVRAKQVPGDAIAVGHELNQAVVMEEQSGTWTRIGEFPDTYDAQGFCYKVNLRAVLSGSDGTVRVGGTKQMYSNDCFGLMDTVGVIYTLDGSTWTESYLGGAMITSLVEADDTVIASRKDGRNDCIGTGILVWNGTEWTETTAVEDGCVFAMWGAGSFAVAVGLRGQGSSASGVILRYEGSSWIEDSVPGLEVLTGVWGRSASDVFAIGNSVVHFDGASWTTLPMPTNSIRWEDLKADDDRLYLVGSDDTGTSFLGAFDSVGYEELCQANLSLRSVWVSPSRVTAFGWDLEGAPHALEPY